MNYEKMYNKIIEFRKTNIPSGYVEKHHIIPRSIGGADTTDNIVKLTGREHFICHVLLVKMQPINSPLRFKMVKALTMMKIKSLSHQGRYFNSRLYEYFRKEQSTAMSIAQSGMKNSQYGSRWIHHKELQKNLKIKIDEHILDGWEEGRIVNWQKYQCKKCGVFPCLNSKICRNTQRINFMIKYLGFDTSTIGSKMIIEEHNLIVSKIKEEYNNGMSIENLRLKYNISSNERLRKFFDSVGIKKRSLSDSLLNYYSKIT